MNANSNGHDSRRNTRTIRRGKSPRRPETVASLNSMLAAILGTDKLRMSKALEELGKQMHADSIRTQSFTSSQMKAIVSICLPLLAPNANSNKLDRRSVARVIGEVASVENGKDAIKQCGAEGLEIFRQTLSKIPNDDDCVLESTLVAVLTLCEQPFTAEYILSTNLPIKLIELLSLNNPDIQHNSLLILQKLADVPSAGDVFGQIDDLSPVVRLQLSEYPIVQIAACYFLSRLASWNLQEALQERISNLGVVQNTVRILQREDSSDVYESALELLVILSSNKVTQEIENRREWPLADLVSALRRLDDRYLPLTATLLRNLSAQTSKRQTLIRVGALVLLSWMLENTDSLSIQPASLALSFLLESKPSRQDGLPDFGSTSRTIIQKNQVNDY